MLFIEPARVFFLLEKDRWKLFPKIQWCGKLALEKPTRRIIFHQRRLECVSWALPCGMCKFHAWTVLLVKVFNLAGNNDWVSSVILFCRGFSFNLFANYAVIKITLHCIVMQFQSSKKKCIKWWQLSCWSKSHWGCKNLNSINRWNCFSFNMKYNKLFYKRLHHRGAHLRFFYDV